MSAPSTAPSHTTSNATTVNPANAHNLTAKQSGLHQYDEILNRSQDKTDKELVVREVTPGVVTFSIPFSRGGLPIGGRSTAIRHSSGNVLLYVSHPHTPATAEVIAGMGGEVKWLVTPDGEHGINFKQYHGAYPNAQTIGVPRYKDKLSEVKWTGLFGAGGETQKYGFEDEISLHRVSAHLNDELLVHHAPSGTLLEADMLFNLPPNEQYSRVGGIPALMKAMGGGSTMAPGGTVHGWMASSISKDKELLRKELAPILALKWDRVIPCHGDVIETGGRTAWDQVWGKFVN